MEIFTRRFKHGNQATKPLGLGILRCYLYFNVSFIQNLPKNLKFKNEGK